MPFRSLYREQMTPAEFQTPGALCIVHPEYEEQDHRNDRYHEMELEYPHYQQTLPASNRVPKYSTTMDVDDDSTYLRQGRLSHLANAASASTNGGLGDTSFSYSQLFEADGAQSSVPSLRTNSMAASSTSETSLGPIGASPEEKICPLITGEIDTCQPGRCGPDAPCMNFTNIPPIEECAEVSCIAARSTEKTSKLERSSTDPIPSPSQSTRKDPSNRPSKAASKVDAKRRAKQAHSLVEKKYRENLNAKLCQLHDTLKTTRYGPKKNRDVEDEDSDEFTTASACNGAKFRKGEVLDDALDYVNQTEVEMRHMENEIHRLMDVVGMMEDRLKFEAARSGKGMMAMPMQVRPV